MPGIVMLGGRDAWLCCMYVPTDVDHSRSSVDDCWLASKLVVVSLPAVYPDLSPRQLEVSLDYINSSLGLSLPAEDVCKLLHSMQLEAAPAAAAANGSTTLLVSVPPTRSDILHGCDVMEDVAIAYGYNNLSKQVGR